MDYIKTVLKTIKDLGVTLVVDGDNIKAKGKTYWRKRWKQGPVGFMKIVFVLGWVPGG